MSEWVEAGREVSSRQAGRSERGEQEHAGEREHHHTRAEMILVSKREVECCRKLLRGKVRVQEPTVYVGGTNCKWWR